MEQHWREHQRVGPWVLVGVWVLITTLSQDSVEGRVWAFLWWGSLGVIAVLLPAREQARAMKRVTAGLEPPARKTVLRAVFRGTGTNDPALADHVTALARVYAERMPLRRTAVVVSGAWVLFYVALIVRDIASGVPSESWWTVMYLGIALVFLGVSVLVCIQPSRATRALALTRHNASS
jgi:hypothetical protein